MNLWQKIEEDLLFFEKILSKYMIFLMDTGIFALGKHFKRESLIHHDSQPVGIPLRISNSDQNVCASACKIFKAVYFEDVDRFVYNSTLGISETCAENS